MNFKKKRDEKLIFVYLTWFLVETIVYFTKNGSEILICVMDMNKAFDLVKQSKLFEK